MKVEVRDGFGPQTLEIIISNPDGLTEVDLASAVTEVYVGVRKKIAWKEDVNAVGPFREKKLFYKNNDGQFVHGASVIKVMFAVNTYLGENVPYTTEQIIENFSGAFSFIKKELDEALQKFFSSPYFQLYVEMKEAGVPWTELKELFYEFRSFAKLPSRSDTPSYEKYDPLESPVSRR